ncbi:MULTISPECIES: TRAP transporter large permease [unclassified Brevibacterium]|uniref:TRAP transporter large permease n=1 Tax=unclassified Brevibacterium TaxID=2614124 RepID=UPI001E481FF3|nr:MULTISPECIES: TRAP transporter large permease [unclassified Brevibacterium]MCD1286080.1 C4-dicarboxylate ABC transporter permease [Brevibacterium sp. CCUG 69071]MDK8433432.1 TRAP transporter large permease [Brevibacterium sp. H-BE7]
MSSSHSATDQALDEAPVGRTEASKGPLDSSRKSKPLGFFISIAVVIICAIGLFTSVSDLASGLWCIGLMVALMFIGVPIPLSLGIASSLGIYYVSGTLALTNVLKTSAFTASSSWSMTVLPLFIFMGLLLTQAGLTQKMYKATELWFGWLPGGLGIGTTAAGAGLASVSGSTIGMTYALGRAGIPEMLRAGYDRRIAVGTVVIAGLPGQLIPPSILLVVYAGIASVPVGPQLMAGVIPGLLIAIAYALMLLFIGIFLPRLVGRDKNKVRGDEKNITWGERFGALAQIWGFPLIMLVLFGGMFTGVFTPSEAGAAAAGMSLVLAIFYTWRNKPIAQVATAAMNAVRSSAAIFFILIGAEMLTRMLAVTGLAESVTSFITDLGLSRFLFLCVLIVLYIFMGMFFDTLAMMLLTIPILMPAFAAYDVNLLWFGVFIVFLGEIGMITPPVGVLSYVVYNICKKREVNTGIRISLGDVFMSLAWFLPLSIAFLIVLILWPDIALWLPGISNA